jgi:hypothetical protein
LNKAVGIRDINSKRRNSQTDIYTEGDIIGAPGRFTQRGAHKELIKNTSGKGILNAHKVDNLIFNDEQAQTIKAGGGGSHSNPDNVVRGNWGGANPRHSYGTHNLFHSGNYIADDSHIDHHSNQRPNLPALHPGNEISQDIESSHSVLMDSFLQSVLNDWVVPPPDNAIHGTYGPPPPPSSAVNTTHLSYPYTKEKPAGGKGNLLQRLQAREQGAPSHQLEQDVYRHHRATFLAKNKRTGIEILEPAERERRARMLDHELAHRNQLDNK